MTEHKAKPEVWARVEEYGSKDERDMLNCLLELRSRVEELEHAWTSKRSMPRSRMTDSTLSPAAQAVINAAVVAGGGYGYATPVLHARLAAALRAAADQAVPEYRENYPNTFDEKHRKTSVFGIRNRILAIAAELENQ